MKKIFIIIIICLVSNISVAQKGADSSKLVYETFQVDSVAHFKGGLNEMYLFISQNLEYPELALDQNAQGTVKLTFIVERNGAITNIKALGNQKIGFGCEEAAINVVQMMDGKWEPAKFKGHAVKMRFILPIRFHIEEDNKSKRRRKKAEKKARKTNNK